MWLYMGSGAAWAAHLRARRVQALAECSAACGAALDWMRRVEPSGPAARARVALGLEAARDCLDLCATAASVSGRGGPSARLAAAPCAEAARRCAEACEALPRSGEADGCARACRRVQDLCARWASM